MVDEFGYGALPAGEEYADEVEAGLGGVDSSGFGGIRGLKNYSQSIERGVRGLRRVNETAKILGVDVSGLVAPLGVISGATISMSGIYHLYDAVARMRKVEISEQWAEAATKASALAVTPGGQALIVIAAASAAGVAAGFAYGYATAPQSGDYVIEADMSVPAQRRAAMAQYQSISGRG